MNLPILSGQVVLPQNAYAPWQQLTTSSCQEKLPDMSKPTTNCYSALHWKERNVALGERRSLRFSRDKNYGWLRKCVRSHEEIRAVEVDGLPDLNGEIGHFVAVQVSLDIGSIGSAYPSQFARFTAKSTCPLI